MQGFLVRGRDQEEYYRTHYQLGRVQAAQGCLQVIRQGHLGPMMTTIEAAFQRDPEEDCDMSSVSMVPAMVSLDGLSTDDLGKAGSGLVRVDKWLLSVYRS